MTMAGYVDLTFFQSLYPDSEIPDDQFNLLAWDASRLLNRMTTGVDGVKKLKEAFPTDEEDAEAVRRCVCKLIYLAFRIQEAETVLENARGYVEQSDGTVKGKIVTSVSAGNESVSYSAGSSSHATIIDKALADREVQERMYQDTVTEYLSGVSDANGVNLLYLGPYPMK